MWSFFKLFFKLGILLLIEYLEKKKEQRDYEINFAKMEEMVKIAIAKMRIDLAQDSENANTMEDAMDAEMRRLTNKE